MEEIISLNLVGNNLFDLVKIKQINKCPICNTTIYPRILRGISFQTEKGEKLSLLCICNACAESFIVQYSDPVPFAEKIPLFRKIDYCEPQRYQSEDFGDLINSASKDFIIIFNQASAAEKFGLDKISGVGYRKALEFLIKDFLISEKPDQEENIRKATLGNCIQQYVDDIRLQTAASRATWLGNDETHYEKLYSNHDIADLKKLIRLSVHWVSMILETKEAELIPSPKNLR